ncbi:MAG: ABC transporter ATP-binding protein [Betaproteobacteria bacterium]|nr:ABC transporter ATP-binding protein [Betaproteobacteria bacterium]
MNPAVPAVQLRSIFKRFGAVHANRDITLSVTAGSIHGLVGENGAGKSTLMAILYGLVQADRGTIVIHGKTVAINNSRTAIALGIGMVHQHFLLIDSMSALDNVLLGAEPHWRLTRSRAVVLEQLKVLIQQTGLEVDLTRLVGELTVGARQRLEILKALLRGARIRQLRARGTTVLVITHKLKEVMTLCDAVTVLRAGQVVFDGPIAQCSLDQLAQAMVGRRVQLERPDVLKATPKGPVSLAVRDLSWRDPQGTQRVSGVNFDLHAGEIVGIAGVAGNGQSELLALLSGMFRPQTGRLDIEGTVWNSSRWLDPTTARRLGMAHVPEDRHRFGVVLPLPLWESALLGYQRSRRFATAWGWVRRQASRAAAQVMLERYDVRPAQLDLQTSTLSGGNQQKLILAREAMAPEQLPKIILIGQPTRGVDIGAIELIYGRLRAMRDGGAAVLLVSSELDEILALADRVLVMNQGVIVGELMNEAVSEAALGRLMAGVSSLTHAGVQAVP